MAFCQGIGGGIVGEKVRTGPRPVIAAVLGKVLTIAEG